MKFSLPNLFTRFACSLVCSAVLCFSSVRATADQSADVASILGILQSIYTGQDAIYTIPYNDPGNFPLDDILGKALYRHYVQGSIPSTGDSYLYQINTDLYGLIYPLLLQLYGSSTNIESSADSINYSTATYLPYLMNLYNDFGLLADQYYNGTWSDAWNVHLSDDSMQMYDYVLSNNLDWLRLEIGSYIGTELKVDLSDITDRQDGQYLFLQGQESDANDEGDELASTVDDWVDAGETADSSKQSEAEEEMKETDEPEMEDYQTASSTSDTYDVNKDDLLDNLSDDNLSHSPIITLIDAEHFKRATGVDGFMEFNMNHGNFGTFVADMSTICRAAWRGLLAIFSALLFWRKQNEISAIVRASNISRVD